MAKTNVKTVVLALAVTALLAAGTYTQAQMRGGWAGRRQQGPSLTEAVAKLDLAESRQRQVHRILSAQQDAQDQDATERESLMQEMEEARQLGDDERMGELRSRLWERRRSGPAGRREALSSLKRVLTEKEYAQLEQSLIGPTRADKVGRFLRELQSVGMNIKQEAMVDKIMSEAMEKVTRVLDSQQRTELAAALERPQRRPGGTRTDAMRDRWQQLSGEQRETINEMRNELWEKLSEAETPEERRQIRTEISQKMRELMEGGQRDVEQEPSEEGADQ